MSYLYYIAAHKRQSVFYPILTKFFDFRAKIYSFLAFISKSTFSADTNNGQKLYFVFVLLVKISITHPQKWDTLAKLQKF